MENKLEAHKQTTHSPETSHALQEALTTYKVCKDSTVVFPPQKCPEEERFLDFHAKI